MFCPLCKLAPITAAKGVERRYLKVDKKEAQKYYICFSGVMEKKPFKTNNQLNKYSYSCILKDSRLIVIEKSS